MLNHYQRILNKKLQAHEQSSKTSLTGISKTSFKGISMTKRESLKTVFTLALKNQGLLMSCLNLIKENPYKQLANTLSEESISILTRRLKIIEDIGEALSTGNYLYMDAKEKAHGLLYGISL